MILTCDMLLLSWHISASNMCYVYFMITQDAAEYLNQKYDDMSCLTAVTGTTVITLNTQHTIIDVPEEFGHAVDKAQS